MYTFEFIHKGMMHILVDTFTITTALSKFFNRKLRIEIIILLNLLIEDRAICTLSFDPLLHILVIVEAISIQIITFKLPIAINKGDNLNTNRLLEPKISIGACLTLCIRKYSVHIEVPAAKGIYNILVISHTIKVSAHAFYLQTKELRMSFQAVNGVVILVNIVLRSAGTEIALL